jgi:hypothetical protein
LAVDTDDTAGDGVIADDGVTAGDGALIVLGSEGAEWAERTEGDTLFTFGC